MAHFAKIDENNLVETVIVVSDEDCLDENQNENEAVGASFCSNLFGGRWVQTSYNSSFRIKHAGIGDTYNEELDAFISPKPFPSWTLDQASKKWVSPIPRPEGELLSWDEEQQEWVGI